MRQSHNTSQRETTHLNYATVGNRSTHELRNKNTPRVQIQTLRFFIESPKRFKRKFRSLELTHSTAARRTDPHTEYQHPSVTQLSIANRRRDESILSSSPQQLLLLQLTTFLSSSVPRIWVFLRAGRAVDDPLCGPQIGDKLKNTPTGNRTQAKKASETLQPEGVPWAKMATVLRPPVRGRASLPLKIAYKKNKPTDRTVKLIQSYGSVGRLIWGINVEEEQIVGTQEKSQQIVAQRLLSCLQYLDATKSSAKDLSLPPCNL